MCTHTVYTYCVECIKTKVVELFEQQMSMKSAVSIHDKSTTYVYAAHYAQLSSKSVISGTM